ncbi:MAG TPA: cbb3-type cytochrome oxidase assembly protein CcoS [Polyangiaceae bacterium]|nr:cbb3-type cytochrome oxidase assembly protein CcoS [Polyangiaceae bacterium]
MTVLFIVLPIAVVLSGVAVAAFLWATNAGQFDDLETPAVRLLCDELTDHTPHQHPKNRPS